MKPKEITRRDLIVGGTALLVRAALPPSGSISVERSNIVSANEAELVQRLEAQEVLTFPQGQEILCLTRLSTGQLVTAHSNRAGDSTSINLISDGQSRAIAELPEGHSRISQAIFLRPLTDGQFAFIGKQAITIIDSKSGDLHSIPTDFGIKGNCVMPDGTIITVTGDYENAQSFFETYNPATGVHERYATEIDLSKSGVVYMEPTMNGQFVIGVDSDINGIAIGRPNGTMSDFLPLDVTLLTGKTDSAGTVQELFVAESMPDGRFIRTFDLSNRHALTQQSLGENEGPRIPLPFDMQGICMAAAGDLLLTTTPHNFYPEVQGRTGVIAIDTSGTAMSPSLPRAKELLRQERGYISLQSIGPDSFVVFGGNTLANVFYPYGSAQVFRVGHGPYSSANQAFLPNVGR